MPASEIEYLERKLRAIEELIKRAGTLGEQQAALAARDRLTERIEHFKESKTSTQHPAETPLEPYLDSSRYTRWSRYFTAEIEKHDPILADRVRDQLRLITPSLVEILQEWHEERTPIVQLLPRLKRRAPRTTFMDVFGR